MDLYTEISLSVFDNFIVYLIWVSIKQGRTPAKYRCRLCDCEFNDETAKDMHIKGKRHKLTFKTKVDPEYDVKEMFVINSFQDSCTIETKS